MTTSIALSPHFETFIRKQVKSGRFNNISEVIRAGLRLLEQQEQRDQLELQALRAEITAGRISGNPKSAKDVFDRLEAKYQAAIKAEGIRPTSVEKVKGCVNYSGKRKSLKDMERGIAKGAKKSCPPLK